MAARHGCERRDSRSTNAAVKCNASAETSRSAGSRCARRGADGYAAAPVLKATLHFFALGALLFAADRVWLAEPAAEFAPPPIVIPEARVEELRRTAWLRGGREPSEAELLSLVDAEVGDELLYRQALAMGFDADDPVIFNRLVMNMRFAGAGDDREAGELYREARELGMHLTDIVVRRRLIQRVRLLIESSAAEPAPTEAELRAHFAARADELIRPERVRLVHRFFARGHEEQAARATAELAGKGPEDAGSVGEAFLHPSEQPLQSHRELANRFGSEFAAGVFGLEPGRWSGPVPSAYGSHAVFVRERIPAEPLAFEEVRDQMRYGVLAEKGAAALARTLERLREGVEVRIEGLHDGSDETG
jgi:hypothetical protein